MIFRSFFLESYKILNYLKLIYDKIIIPTYNNNDDDNNNNDNDIFSWIFSTNLIIKSAMNKITIIRRRRIIVICKNEFYLNL